MRGMQGLDKYRAGSGCLELSCENTDSGVLLIDLVNEILEGTVAPEAPRTQTIGTVEELAANPQHVNEGAYDAKSPNTVASAIYPWTLPFDLWTAEARLYLTQLGVSRDQLLTG